MSKKFWVLLALLMPLSAQALTLKTPNRVKIDADKLVFEFSDAMIALGQMERDAKDIPIEFSPAVKCEWRWLNQKALGCFLGQNALKPETKYTMTFGTFAALDGQKISPKKASFTTPEITVNKNRSRFDRFENPNRPVWRIEFTAPVAAAEQVKLLRFGGEKAVELHQKCPEWDDFCAYKIDVMPEKDLAANAEYTVEYKGETVAKGRTLPPLGVVGVKCMVENWQTKQYAANEEAFCLDGSYIAVKMTDSVVQENIKDFVAKAENRAVISDEIPLILKSGQTVEIPVSAGMRDRWGNSLTESALLKVRVSDREPQLRTTYEQGVLESAEQTDFRGFAQNLDSAAIVFKGFSAGQNVQGRHQIFDVHPDIRNVMYPFSYGIRTMLEGKSGYLSGTFDTDPKRPYPQRFTAIVAPWQAVAKVSADKTVVWVNDLKTGKPVKRASVELYAQNPEEPAADIVPILTAKTDRKGVAELGGYAALGDKTELLKSWSDAKERLFVRVVKDGDMTVLPLTYPYEISAGAVSDWTVSTTYEPQTRQSLRTFGITPQGIYRQGDAVDYKIYVRADGLKAAPNTGYDLQVFDSMGQVVYERKDIALSDFGAFDGSFKLSAQAVAGTYEFQLKAGETMLTPMKILVSDFTPMPFKVKTDADTDFAAGGDVLTVSGNASLLSGGAFANAAARQTAVLSFAPFKYENFDFHSSDSPEETLLDRTDKTDAKGELASTVSVPKSDKETGTIRFETRVFDDSGRFASSIKTVPYFASKTLVGIRKEKWFVPAGAETALDVVVVSPDKQLVSAIPVKVEIYQKSNRLIRERTAGNVYVLKYEPVEDKVGECALISADKPVKCAFTPEKAGQYKAVAKIGESTAETAFYAEGAGYVPWEANKDVVKLSFDKKEYAVGDTIEMMVENPFKDGRALITVERDGILKSWVETMDKGTEKVKIKVSKDFFPGVYVSVNLFSPRVADSSVEPDLGKPSEKTGYAKIGVVDKARVLDVKITPEKQEYRPKQTAKVTLFTAAKQPVELAVAVLDEAVLALLPNGIESFNPLPELNKTGDLDVRTYSLIAQLVGRQKVDKKGANQGGDGGSDFAVRDLFKLVGYWNPSLKTDKDGEASFEMVLPDNLTSWKVVAVAMTPTDFAGLGQADFKVVQPLELRALLPNQVRVGDTFAPAVSVMNRTKTEQTVAVALNGEVKTESLKPFERKAVFFAPVKAGKTDKISLLFTADSGKDKDALKVEIPVLKNKPEQTAAMFGRIDGTEELPLDIPADSVLTLSVSPTVANAMDSAIKAMIEYPFGCWEQKISRAWAAAVAGEKWTDGGKFAQAVLDDMPSFQTPDGGMAYFVNYSGFDSPYLSAYTGYVLTRLKAKGFAVSPIAEEKLGAYLLRIFNGRKSVETPTAVRALAVPYLIDRGLIDTADLEPLRRDLPKMTAFEKAVLHPYMPTDLLTDVYKTSGAVIVAEDGGQSFAVLPSRAKTNCAVLQALPEKRELMNGVLALRGKDGTWGSTQANAFCLDALDAYMAVNETAVDAKVIAKIGEKRILDDTMTVNTLQTAVPFAQPETQTLTMMKNGTGNPYYAAVLNYPVPVKTAINAGLQVERTYSVELDGEFVETTAFKRGQTVRVTLSVHVPAFQSFVAVSDPVVGAFEPLNSLQTDVGRDGFYFKDSNFKQVTFFAEELQAGTYVLTYDAQVVADGVFTAFPAKAEAMYLPDVFGLSTVREITVQ